MKLSRIFSGARSLAALLPLTAAFAGHAAVSLPDSLIELKSRSTKIIHIDGRPVSEEEKTITEDSIRKVVTMFYYDQFRHFQDPDAPYFLFMSKDAGLSMGIGGSVRMRAYYDWDGALPTNSFAPYTIPIPANPASMRHFGTTPSGTNLFFRVIGRNRVMGNYQLYIEAEFSGYDNRDLKLKKAYALVRDFTFGYASSTFSDPAAQPPVIDGAGNNNKFTHTTLLVRYMPNYRNRWFAGISVETPSTAVDAVTSFAEPVKEWLPDAAALLQYQWEQGQHVRLSGIVRSLSYRDLKTSRNHNLAGWGVQLSSVAHPASPLTTYAVLSLGRGIAGLGSDMQYGHYDLIPDPENPAELYAPLTWGWTAGLQYNFRPDLFASISASQTHFNPRKGVSGDEYKYGTFACANVFWNILPRLSTGAEFDFGFRGNYSGVGRRAYRANIMAAFTF